MKRIGLLAALLVTLSSHSHASAIGAIGSLIIKVFGDGAASRELVQSGRAIRDGAENLPSAGRSPDRSSAPTETVSLSADASKSEGEVPSGRLPLGERDISTDEVLRRGVAGGRPVLEGQGHANCADGNGHSASEMNDRSACVEPAHY